MVALMVASLIPPIFLFVHAYARRDGVEGVIAVACGVLYLLMLSRLWDVAASRRRGLIRERTLRVASAALASAGSVEEVATAVRDAAATLIAGQPAERTALLAVQGRRLPAPRAPGGLGRAAAPRATRSSIWLRLAEARHAAVRLHRGDQVRQARDRAGRPGRPTRRHPSGYEGALLCPLTLKDRPAGDPFIGLLAFFGDRRTLADLSTVLEILAGQAALAVERLALTQEVVRQRGEALFRTLVQDASDVILIVGDDRRIRYATPSAADIFGDVTVEGALLVDLVAPGAREDVDRVLDLMLTLSAGNATRGVSPGYLLQIERLDGRHGRARGPLERPAARLDGRRPRAHPAGRDRAARARGGAEVPGLPRRADRAAQPVAVRARGGGRARDGPRRRPDRGRAVRRPGRLQGRQRHDGARRRRRAARRGRRPAGGRGARVGHRGAARRRRVRAAHRRRRRSRGGGRVRGADRGGVHRAVHPQRGQGARHGHRRRGDLARTAATWTSCCATRTSPCTRRSRRASGAGGTTSRC